ncbi:MAG: M3 family oligoendopeptidase [Actinobacteria bacterium]|nr:M3 family oligoendopeptidase [Actinomycetota bacterium]
MVVDLKSRLISIDQYEASLRRFRTRQSVGPKYVELIHLARGIDAPERLPLRGADMYEIALALNLPTSFIRRDVRNAMAFLADGKPTGGLLGYIAPASGLAIASTFAAGVYSQVVDGPEAAVTARTSVADPLTAAEFAAAIVSDSTLRLDPVSPPLSADSDPARLDPARFGSAQSALGQARLDGTTPEQVGQLALDLLSYDWQRLLPGWSIEFKQGRDGILGYAFFDEQRIEVYVRPSHGPTEVAATLAHELGHAVDVSLLTNDDRASWAALRSIDSTWWPGSTGSDFASGAGDFAEAFATWQVGEVSRSEVAGQPTLDQLALLASLAT